MKHHMFRVAGVMLLLMAGAAQAQTVPSTPVPSEQAPADPAAKPSTPTPSKGVARGVIRPNRPVDRGMVTRPPNPHQHNMPVITPPGTAR